MRLVNINGYSDYFIRNFVFCHKTFLRALCGFFVLGDFFLLRGPQSRRKGHQGVFVFITHLILYFNKVTLVFLSASTKFF